MLRKLSRLTYLELRGMWWEAADNDDYDGTTINNVDDVTTHLVQAAGPDCTHSAG